MVILVIADNQKITTLNQKKLGNIIYLCKNGYLVTVVIVVS